MTDTGFDINQLFSAYYSPVYGNNSDFKQWAIENNRTNETVSPVYFYFSCAFLMVYPIALQLLVLTFHRKTNFDDDKDVFLFPFRAIKEEIKQCRCWYATVSIILAPIYGTNLAFILMPLASLGYAFGFAGDSLDDEDFECYIKRKADDSEKQNRTMLQWLVFINIGKFLECTLEALPQTIINIIYLCNNMNFILDNSLFLGFRIPIPVISLIFSVVSLLHGIVTGVQFCTKRIKITKESSSINK